MWRSVYKIFYNLVTLPRFNPIKKVVWSFLAFLIIITLAFPIPLLYNQIKFSSRIYTAEAAPQRPVALVLGAGVWTNGQPSSLLVERVKNAANLIRVGKVEKLLLSADNRSVANYETDEMRELALDLGIPVSALIQDNGGFSTLDSCQRASSVYHITSVLIVSQYFQLPRAMFLCESSGLEVVGLVSANGNGDLKSLILWQLREIPASLLAWFQVNLLLK
jgi:vancomycin permeability regulator SanA